MYLHTLMYIIDGPLELGLSNLTSNIFKFFNSKANKAVSGLSNEVSVVSVKLII